MHIMSYTKHVTQTMPYFSHIPIIDYNIDFKYMLYFENF